MMRPQDFKAAAAVVRNSGDGWHRGSLKQVVELLEDAASFVERVTAKTYVVDATYAQPNESPSLAALAAALAKAQGEISNAIKNIENSFLKSNYADLASVWNACRKALSANGLSVVQRPHANDDLTRVEVETLLLHSSGEWLRNRMTVKVEPTVSKTGGQQTWIQAYGSAVTYARRYALAAMVGVATEEDDDGNGGEETTGREQASSLTDKAKAKLIDDIARGVKLEGEPVAVFGDEGTKGTKLAALSVAQLEHLLSMGRESVVRSPRAPWAPSVAANLKQIEAELAKRKQSPSK